MIYDHLWVYWCLWSVGAIIHHLWSGLSHLAWWPQLATKDHFLMWGYSRWWHAHKHGVLLYRCQPVWRTMVINSHKQAIFTTIKHGYQWLSFCESCLLMVIDALKTKSTTASQWLVNHLAVMNSHAGPSTKLFILLSSQLLFNKTYLICVALYRY